MFTSPSENNSIRQNALSRFWEKLASGYYHTRKVENCHCGAAEFVVLDTKDRNEIDFCSLLCMNCGLVHTDPRLAEDSLPEFYNSEYYPIAYGTLSATNLQSLTTTNFRPYQGYEIYDRRARC